MDKEEVGQKIKFDLKNRKILYELDRNARQSNSEIAKKVRLSKSTVNYKIKRMQDEKLILGYYTVIDYSRLGFIGLRIYLKFFTTTPKIEQEMTNWLIAHKLVGVIGKTEAIYDLAFHLWAKHIHEFDDFWLKFKKKFRRYLWKEKVYLVSKVYHFKRKYLLGKPSPEYELIGSAEKASYDELDFKILKLLSKNARAPILELSEKLKKPPRTIAFRIKQLEKKRIIQGYRVNLSVEKLGYEYYKLNCILNSMENYDKLFQFAQQHPNIIYIDRTVSELDLELDMEVKGRKEMLNFIKELKEKFNIRDVEIFTFKEYYKLELIPEK